MSFLPYLQTCRIVHDLSVIFSDKLLLDVVACFAVHLVAIYLTVAVDGSVFTGKENVFGGNMVLVTLTLVCSQLTAEVLVRSVYKELISPVRIIGEAVVKVRPASSSRFRLR